MEMIQLVDSITVLQELKDFIIPLNREEFSQLEQNIVRDGCRECLTLWKRGNKHILIDGHNRLSICRKHNIPFKTKHLSFASLDEVKIWMANNQIGRRNLTPDQVSYYRGIKYLSLKKCKGGYENVKSKGQVETSTSASLAKQFNVSESTIKRDAKFAEGLELIGNSNSKLKIAILAGAAKVKKADIQMLTETQDKNLKIKNEADLYNKANIIRKDLLSLAEQNIREVQDVRLKKAQQILEQHEPAFLDKDDRLKKIKGRIISAINAAILQKDYEAIKRLRKLTDKLEGELFDDDK